ncbi:MAG TPA: adenylyl-sulfate kinase [Opitutaceae bacterium]|nr:adenylyl-sulfate kinase [Opitutaceae bacterium]HND61282.1 adenylyl-sulfate kinase [Opitutaceae bacterium]
MSSSAPKPGHIFWLMGLSGAGKSTLASQLVAALRSQGLPVLPLDGDALRAGVCQGLGFTAADRAENLRRAACIARMARDAGICTVASFITPLESHRQLIREVAGAEGFSLVYMDAPYDVCRQRDVKGLYARAAAGKVANFTGLSDGFEAPTQVDLLLHTGAETATASAARLVEFARSKV